MMYIYNSMDIIADGPMAVSNPPVLPAALIAAAAVIAAVIFRTVRKKK